MPRVPRLFREDLSERLCKSQQPQLCNASTRLPDAEAYEHFWLTCNPPTLSKILEAEILQYRLLLARVKDQKIKMVQEEINQ